MLINVEFPIIKRNPLLSISKGFLHMGEYVNIMDNLVVSYTYIVI